MNKMNNKPHIVLTFCGVLFYSIVAAADMPSLSHSLVALQGYDPVAYFTEKQAKQGSGNHTYRYQDVAYIFASRDNLNTFKENPEKYLPQYGGFCAFAIAQRKRVVADPNAWKIVDDKLYLNLNKKVQKIWEKKIEEYIESADANWPSLKEKPF